MYDLDFHLTEDFGQLRAARVLRPSMVGKSSFASPESLVYINVLARQVAEGSQLPPQTLEPALTWT